MKDTKLFATICLALALAITPAPAQIATVPSVNAAAQADTGGFPEENSLPAVQRLMINQMINWAAVINQRLYAHYEQAYENWKLNRGLPSEFAKPSPPFLWEAWVNGEPGEVEFIEVGVRETPERAESIVEELPPAPKFTVCVGEIVPHAASWYQVCAGDNAPFGTTAKAPDGTLVRKILIPFIGSATTVVYQAQ